MTVAGARLLAPSSVKLAFALGLILARPTLARGETPSDTPEAALVHIDCEKPRLDGAALFESLALELQAQGISLRPLNAFKSDDNFVLEVRTDCATRQQLILRAARGVESAEETFSLADVPRSSEPRTVALALAELLEDFRNNRGRDAGDSSTADASPSPSPSGKAAVGSAVGPSLDLGPEVDNAFRGDPPVTIRDTPPEPEPDPGVHLMAMFGVEQRTFRLSNSLVGLNAGFSLERAELGASLLRGDATTTEDQSTTLVVGNLALGYRVAEVTNGRWTAAVIPRVGFGNLVATGSTSYAVNEPGTGTASELYGDVAARVSVNARLWSRLGLTLNSEAGYGRGLVAIVDGQSTGDLTGLFLGVELLGSLDFSSRKASRLWPPVSAKEQ